MGDYDYCKQHDISFLMPDLLMCPVCAVEKLMAGAVPEPLGDALIEAIKTRDDRASKLMSLLMRVRANHPNGTYGISQMASGAESKALWAEVDAALAQEKAP